MKENVCSSRKMTGWGGMQNILSFLFKAFSTAAPLHTNLSASSGILLHPFSLSSRNFHPPSAMALSFHSQAYVSSP